MDGVRNENENWNCAHCCEHSNGSWSEIEYENHHCDESLPISDEMKDLIIGKSNIASAIRRRIEKKYIDRVQKKIGREIEFQNRNENQNSSSIPSTLKCGQNLNVEEQKELKEKIISEALKQINNSTSSSMPSLVCYTARQLRGVSFSSCVVDSACNSSMVGKKTLEYYEHKKSIQLERHPRYKKYAFAGGKTLAARAYVLIHNIKFFVIESAAPFLLGTDVLASGDINLKRRVLRVKGKEIPMFVDNKLFRIRLDQLQDLVPDRKYVTEESQEGINEDDSELCLIVEGAEDQNENLNVDSELIQNQELNENPDAVQPVNPKSKSKSKLNFQETQKIHIQKRHLHPTQMILQFPTTIDRETAQRVYENCPPCQLSKRRHRFNPMKKRFKLPNQCICLDVLYVNYRDAMYSVLHLVDSFTKWSLLIAFPRAVTGFDVIRGLDEWKTVHSALPKSIFTDGGSEFINSIVREFCVNEDITHYQTTAGVHESNGLVESHNRQVRRRVEILARSPARELDQVTMGDLCRWTMDSKNSFVRKIGGRNISAQEAALGHQICWENPPTSWANPDFDACLRQRQDVKDRAAELVNLKQEQDDVKQLLKKRDTPEAWEAGDHCLVLQDETKTLEHERLKIAEVLAMKGKTIGVVRLRDGQVLEVHRSRMFCVPSFELEVNDKQIVDANTQPVKQKEPEAHRDPAVADPEPKNEDPAPRNPAPENPAPQTPEPQNPETNQEQPKIEQEPKVKVDEDTEMRIKEIALKNAKSIYNLCMSKVSKTSDVKPNLFLGHKAKAYGPNTAIPAPTAHNTLLIRFAKKINSITNVINNPKAEDLTDLKHRLCVVIEFSQAVLDAAAHPHDIQPLGNVHDSKHKKKFDLEKLDPHNYEPVEEPQLNKLEKSQINGQKDVIDELRTKQLRWLSKYYGIPLKNGKPALVKNLKMYLVGRTRALSAEAEVANCSFRAESPLESYFSEDALDDAEPWSYVEIVDPDALTECYSAVAMEDHYELLRAAACQAPNSEIWLEEQDPTFSIISNIEGLPKQAPAFIHVTTNRGSVKMGMKIKKNDYYRISYAILPEQIEKKQIGEPTSMKSVVITLFYRAVEEKPKTKPNTNTTSTTSNPTAATQDPKAKPQLKLPPELIGKGTVELNYEFFEENNLTDELIVAIRKELSALNQFKVFDVVPEATAEGKKIMSSRLILAIKLFSDGSLKKVKCRFVPRGFANADFRSDYLRRDTKTVSCASLLLSLQSALNNRWKLATVDFSNAFLQQDTITDNDAKPLCHFPEVSHLPSNIQDAVSQVMGKKPGCICRYNKSCYGYIDAPRAWYRKLTARLKQLGFRPTRSDPACYVLVGSEDGKAVKTAPAVAPKLDGNAEDVMDIQDPDGPIIGLLLLHVDDCLLMGNDVFQDVVKQLKASFLVGDCWDEKDTTEEDQRFTFLGRDIVVKSKPSRELHVTQENYIASLVEIPIPESVSLSSPLDPERHALYRAAVGKLQWVIWKTRPDLSFAAWKLSTRVGSPCWDDVSALNKTIRTANFHKSTCLKFRPMKNHMKIVALTDATYNRHRVEVPLFGAIFFLVDSTDAEFDQMLFSQDPQKSKEAKTYQFVDASPIYWRVRQVKRRIDSILDCETLSVQYGTNTAQYLTGLATEMGIKCGRPTIYNDNNSCVSHIKSSNKSANARLNVIFNTLSESYSNGKYALYHICGKERNIADIFTKSKSNMTNLFYRSLKIGKLSLPKK